MNTEDLIAALREADLTPEQWRLADDLIDALRPRMAEPKWPGACIMARCPGSYGGRGENVKLHVRRLEASDDGTWECAHFCIGRPFLDLLIPRPCEPVTDELLEKCIREACERLLTPDERAEYGIPGECDRPHAEPITDELVERAAEAMWGTLGDGIAWGDAHSETRERLTKYARAALVAAGHPEANDD